MSDFKNQKVSAGDMDIGDAYLRLPLLFVGAAVVGVGLVVVANKAFEKLDTKKSSDE